MLLPPSQSEQGRQAQLRLVLFVLDTSGSMEGDAIE